MRNNYFLLTIAVICLWFFSPVTVSLAVLSPLEIPADDPPKGEVIDFVGPVKILGRQLLVDFDQNGIYDSYIIKGVGYSPYPIGRYPNDGGSNIYNDQNILQRDFSNLSQMYANTIRIWKGNQTGSTVYITQKTLDTANQYGLKVIAGFWVNTSAPQCSNNTGQMDYWNPDFTNQSIRNQYKQEFVNYVNTFKNNPAILFWAIGNEDNLHINPTNGTQFRAFYSLVNEMAQAAHAAEGWDRYHPVAIINGDLSYIGDSNFGTNDSQLPYVDIWAANVYRGSSFGTLFSEYQAKSAKPFWISEYGVDAVYAPKGIPSRIVYEDQASQATWDGNLWDEIVSNKNVSIGATVMEYSDEWWKPETWLTSHTSVHLYGGRGPQDTSCPADGTIDWVPPAPDQYFNENWWGIMSISNNPIPNGPNIMTSRQVYGALSKRFACSDAAPYYSGPENNKSCDVSNICCDSSSQFSKNGICVSSCNFRKPPPQPVGSGGGFGIMP